MQSQRGQKTSKTPLSEIIAYASGDGAFSLTMNGIWAFSLLFYTQALGLDHKLAGLALSIAVFWDAITDPVMGYISDHTRSRFGRRHPYILIGGILLAVSFYFLWAIPPTFKGVLLFWYLLFVNILIRTAVTIFYIPYLALGFEICQDYHERSKLQGARHVVNMIANLLGPALAWSVFFKDNGPTPSTNVPANYLHMGAAFSIATLVIVILVTFATRRHLVDSTQMALSAGKWTAFFKETQEILRDKYSPIIYLFYGVLQQGCVLVASLQMYLYIYFMNFSDVQKSIVHGSTMVGYMIGSFFSSIIARRIDKKPTVIFGALASIIGNLALAGLFLSGLVRPGATLSLAGFAFPFSTMIFILFHAGYWFGNGVMTPITFSMVADTAEINKVNTGVLKDGSYSAMFSFMVKLASSVGLLLTGGCLSWIGFVSGGASQTPQAIHNLAIATFFSGVLFAIIALAVIWGYPIDKKAMDRIKSGEPLFPGETIQDHAGNSSKKSSE